MGFPGGAHGKEPACQCRRHKRVIPWVRHIPWKRVWQSTPVLLPGESPWSEEPVGYSSQDHKESDKTKKTEHARTQWESKCQ